MALNDLNNRINPEKRLQLEENSRPRQQVLSQLIDSHTLDTIRDSARNNPHFQAHLNLTTASRAGSWLHAVPSKALGTHVDPMLYKTMIQRWVRIPLQISEFHCPLCDHCLTCSCGGDRTKRHNLLRNEVFHLWNSGDLNPELKPQGLLQLRPTTCAAQTHHMCSPRKWRK